MPVARKRMQPAAHSERETTDAEKDEEIKQLFHQMARDVETLGACSGGTSWGLSTFFVTAAGGGRVPTGSLNNCSVRAGLSRLSSWGLQASPRTRRRRDRPRQALAQGLRQATAGVPWRGASAHPSPPRRLREKHPPLLPTAILGHLRPHLPFRLTAGLSAAKRPRIPASVGKGMARKEEQREEQARMARAGHASPRAYEMSRKSAARHFPARPQLTAFPTETGRLRSEREAPKEEEEARGPARQEHRRRRVVRGLRPETSSCSSARRGQSFSFLPVCLCLRRRGSADAKFKGGTLFLKPEEKKTESRGRAGDFSGVFGGGRGSGGKRKKGGGGGGGKKGGGKKARR